MAWASSTNNNNNNESIIIPSDICRKSKNIISDRRTNIATHFGFILLLLLLVGWNGKGEAWEMVIYLILSAGWDAPSHRTSFDKQQPARNKTINNNINRNFYKNHWTGKRNIKSPFFLCAFSQINRFNDSNINKRLWFNGTVIEIGTRSHTAFVQLLLFRLHDPAMTTALSFRLQQTTNK